VRKVAKKVRIPNSFLRRFFISISLLRSELTI
jgi:hypothetical protein